MSVTTWRAHPEKTDIEILDVPAYSQRGVEKECLLQCVRMSIDYLAKSYPNDWIRNNISTVDLSFLRRFISVSGAGWTPDDSELESLSAELGPINFTHTMERQSPKEETFYRIIRNNLDQHLPIIPIINAKKLRYGSKGGAHAVVVVGMNEDSIAINDPWGYPYDIVGKEDFIPAWDDTINQFVTLEVGGQQTLARGNSGGSN